MAGTRSGLPRTTSASQSYPILQIKTSSTLGVSLGHRRLLMREIANLGKTAAASPTVPSLTESRTNARNGTSSSRASVTPQAHATIRDVPATTVQGAYGGRTLFDPMLNLIGLPIERTIDCSLDHKSHRRCARLLQTNVRPTAPRVYLLVLPMWADLIIRGAASMLHIAVESNV